MKQSSQVYLVDDDTDFREATCELLEGAGLIRRVGGTGAMPTKFRSWRRASWGIARWLRQRGDMVHRNLGNRNTWKAVWLLLSFSGRHNRPLRC